MPHPVKNCAVVGSPIAHSRSPVLHRSAYAALGLTDWTYDRVELQPEQLPGWLSGLDESWRGISVTMPLKQAALACADTAEELASTLGAANTLLQTEAGWHADNTDVAGLVGALGEVEVHGAGQAASATVIGAGGTAAAAVIALAELGYGHIDMVVRDPSRARALFVLLDKLGMTGRAHPWPGTFSGESHFCAAADGTFSGESPLGADLVISTVPAPATTDLLTHRWRIGQTVVDVSYDPWPTALVVAAGRAGAHAIGGAAVLLWQAVGQVELMTGHAAPVEVMRTALLPGGNLAPP